MAVVLDPSRGYQPLPQLGRRNAFVDPAPQRTISRTISRHPPESIRAYHPTPADRLREAVAAALVGFGLEGSRFYANKRAATLVGFTPVGALEDLNNGILQTGRGVANQSAGDTLGGVLAMALAGVPKPVKKFVPERTAETIARQLERAGFSVERAASGVSSSRYVTASLRDADGNYVLEPYKIRVSDHDLPPSYGGADYDVGPHDLGNSDWTRVVNLLTERAGLSVPPAVKAVMTRNARIREQMEAEAKAAAASRGPSHYVLEKRNDALLAAAGLSGLRGKARKRALTKLR